MKIVRYDTVVNNLENELINMGVLKSRSANSYKDFINGFLVLKTINSESRDLVETRACNQLYGIGLLLSLDVCYNAIFEIVKCSLPNSEVNNFIDDFVSWKRGEIDDNMIYESFNQLSNKNYKDTLIRLLIFAEFCNS